MSKKYTQRFRQEWLNDSKYSKWLSKAQGDDTKAYCKLCTCIITAKLSDLEKHRATAKHKRAEEPFSYQRQRTLPFERVDNESRKSEAQMAMFIAEHCALRVVDHLTDMCKACFSDSKGCKDLKLKRSKCSALICNVIAPHFKQELIDDIGSRKFSLIIDESNDISVTKLLGIGIRYFSASRKTFVTTFLDLVELDECNADALCHAIKKSLDNHGLKLQKLIAIGTDNASVMTGVNNGVYVKLKAENPSLLLIRCTCHSLQLAVSHAAKEYLPRHLEVLIKDCYNWFSHSSLRQMKYKKLYAMMNDGMKPLKLVQLSDTRWMSIEAAIVRVLKQWDELKTHFECARREEKCYTAEQLYLMLCDKKNYVFLTFLKHVLGEVQFVNKKFEAETNDPTKLLNDLVQLIDSLSSKVLIPGRRITEAGDIERFLDPNCYLGYEFEKNMKEGKFRDEPEIRKRCIGFVVCLVKELQNRLPDNVKVLRLMSTMSASECLQPIKPGILDLAKMFEQNDEVLTRIDFQWKKLHHTVWKKNHDTLQFWAEVADYRDATGDNPYSDICELALTVLSLPHSNADVERLFSNMNIVKTKQRNRMNNETLTAVLAVKYGLQKAGKCCYNYTLPADVLKKIGTLEAYEKHTSEAASTSSFQCTAVDIDDWDLSEF